ncbi:MAG: capsule assembly Wzi family protein [Aureispira sp.]
MKNTLLLIFCCYAWSSLAQSSLIVPLNDINHQLHNRLEVQTGTFGGIHGAVKPLWRADVVHYQNTNVPEEYWSGNKRRSWNYQYVHNDYNDIDSTIKSKRSFAKFLYPNGDRSFLRHFYRTPAHFLEARTPKFYVNVNPIIHVKGSVEQYNGQTRLTFLNRRGASIRGNILGRVFFYTDVIDTQADFPTYVGDRLKRDYAVPGAGFFKQFDSSLKPGEDTSGVDYLMAQGYIAVDLLQDHIGVQFGHGQNFIGDGHRSLFLSDYSTNYLYLKINTRIWKIHYQNIFAELTQNYGESQRAFDLALPKKYMAAHYLSINILKNLNVGLFESSVFSRGGRFDLQYLNPLILYRAVEQAVGSPDNIVLGLSWKWNFLKRFSFYGQFLLDELSVGDLVRLGGGWWGNKFAFQAGLKYINAFKIDQLDLQVEYNVARPYTYSFRDSSANYTHYNQSLAHPLGANFHELIGIANYQLAPGMFLRGQINYAYYGRDSLGSNWGGNPSVSYLSRSRNLENVIGQGVSTHLLIAQLRWQYQVRHNLALDAQVMYRREDTNIDALDNSTWLFSLGLRWNISEKMRDW